jgi:hypothetical protein
MELTLGLMRLFESGPELHAGRIPGVGRRAHGGIAERLGVDPLRDPVPRLVATVGFAVLSATVHSWGETGGARELLELLDEGFAELRRVTVDTAA